MIMINLYIHKKTIKIIIFSNKIWKLCYFRHTSLYLNESQICLVYQNLSRHFLLVVMWFMIKVEWLILLTIYCQQKTKSCFTIWHFQDSKSTFNNLLLKTSLSKNLAHPYPQIPRIINPLILLNWQTATGTQRVYFNIDLYGWKVKKKANNNFKDILTGLGVSSQSQIRYLYFTTFKLPCINTFLTQNQLSLVTCVSEDNDTWP